MNGRTVRFGLNGRAVELDISPDRLLIDLLREEFRLTGTKEGCSVGVCGLCTVLVDGAPMSACLLLSVLVDGTEVVTIEGVADGEELSALQQAFIQHGGFQCGICTPGQILSASALLAETSNPDRAEVEEFMLGNLCRCTGYEGIAAAITAASTSGL